MTPRSQAHDERGRTSRGDLEIACREGYDKREGCDFSTSMVQLACARSLLYDPLPPVGKGTEAATAPACSQMMRHAQPRGRIERHA
jgi:hypothetical protein